MATASEYANLRNPSKHLPLVNCFSRAEFIDHILSIQGFLCRGTDITPLTHLGSWEKD